MLGILRGEPGHERGTAGERSGYFRQVSAKSPPTGSASDIGGLSSTEFLAPTSMTKRFHELARGNLIAPTAEEDYETVGAGPSFHDPKIVAQPLEVPLLSGDNLPDEVRRPAKTKLRI